MVSLWRWFWETFTRACEIKRTKDAKWGEEVRMYAAMSYMEKGRLYDGPALPQGYSLFRAFLDAMDEEDDRPPSP